MDELSEPTEAVVAFVADLEGPLLLLGAGGKIGHSLARMVQRATQIAGRGPRVVAVSRFSQPVSREAFEHAGIQTIAADLSSPGEVQALPDAPNVVYLLGQKFGTTAHPSLTWLANAFIPGLVCQRFPRARIVAFSSGNVYPFSPVREGGCTEEHAVGPVGEYAQSVVGRERIFEHFSRENGTPLAILRLNYANEPRYGVLVDLAEQLLAGKPIDLTMGHVNLVWQSDCNRVTLLALAHATCPPTILNLAGPQVRVRDVAERLAQALGVQPQFVGQEAPTALLSNGSRCWQLFGPPRVDVDQMIDRVAAWLKAGGPTAAKPSKYDVRNGNF